MTHQFRLHYDTRTMTFTGECGCGWSETGLTCTRELRQAFGAHLARGALADLAQAV